MLMILVKHNGTPYGTIVSVSGKERFVFLGEATKNATPLLFATEEEAEATRAKWQGILHNAAQRQLTHDNVYGVTISCHVVPHRAK